MKITGIETKIVVRGGKRKSTYMLIPVSVASCYRTFEEGDVVMDIEGTKRGTIKIDVRIRNINFKKVSSK